MAGRPARSVVEALTTGRDGGVRGIIEAPPAQRPKGGVNSSRDVHKKKTSVWSDRSLENALNSIINDGMSFREASKVYGIPTTSIRDHLYSRTTTRQKGIRSVLAAHEKKKIIDYVFKMQDLGHPLTPVELRLKVAVAIQTRFIPWNASGVPSKG